MTEQRQMEQQLFQSEKMASLGQLVAGVAHEINNPLGFIVSNQNNFAEYVQELTSLLDAYTTLEELIQRQAYDLLPQSVAQLRERKKVLDFDYMRAELAPMLESSRKGLQRITGSVKALRLFAHPEREEWRPYNLHEGIDSCLELLRFQVGERIQIQKDYGKVPTLYVKGDQMNQVFMNLFSNSIQAIEGEGRIRIQTQVKDPIVQIDIEDSGCGIPEMNLPKIFDPFFTTKPPGQGTGLGLSLSYRIIEAHGGVITVRSIVGKGTTVRVELPINVKRDA